MFSRQEVRSRDFRIRPRLFRVLLGRRAVLVRKRAPPSRQLGTCAFSRSRVVGRRWEPSRVGAGANNTLSANDEEASLLRRKVADTKRRDETRRSQRMRSAMIIGSVVNLEFVSSAQPTRYYELYQSLLPQAKRCTLIESVLSWRIYCMSPDRVAMNIHETQHTIPVS